MKIVIQRTSGVEVIIDGRIHSQTGSGLLILFGTKIGDTEKSCGYLADKTVNLRIFEDEQEKMNLSALDMAAEIMIVSQFTLYADTSKGRRPSYGDAQQPDQAKILYDRFIELIAASGLKTASGVFGASMDLKFTNQGPVTIIIEHEL